MAREKWPANVSVSGDRRHRKKQWLRDSLSRSTGSGSFFSHWISGYFLLNNQQWSQLDFNHRYVFLATEKRRRVGENKEETCVTRLLVWAERNERSLSKARAVSSYKLVVLNFLRRGRSPSCSLSRNCFWSRSPPQFLLTPSTFLGREIFFCATFKFQALTDHLSIWVRKGK